MWLIFRAPESNTFALPAAPVIYFNLCGQPSGSPCWARVEAGAAGSSIYCTHHFALPHS